MTSEEICVFSVRIAGLRAWAHSCGHRSLALILDILLHHLVICSHTCGILLLLEAHSVVAAHHSRVFWADCTHTTAVVVVDHVSHLAVVASMLLRLRVGMLLGGWSVLWRHLLVWVPINPAGLIHRLVVITVRRVVELVNDVLLVWIRTRHHARCPLVWRIIWMEVYSLPCCLLLVRALLLRHGSSCLVSHTLHVMVLVLIGDGRVLRDRQVVIHHIGSNDLATRLLLVLD